MDSEKLIEYVKEYKCLYDLNDKKYNDNQKKDAAWKTIAMKLRVPEKQCKKSWFLLRDAYRRAIKKKKEAIISQSDIIKKWKFEDEMAFVLPFMKERSTNNDTNEDYINYDETMENMYCEGSNTFPVDVLQVKAEPSAMSDSYQEFVPNTPMPTTSVATPPKRKKRNSISKKQMTDQTLPTSLMKYILANKKKDDIEQFFASIATTVQSFPSKDRAIAKAKVFEIISHMEMDILNRPASDSSSESDYSDSGREPNPYEDL